jgi:ABC-type oligopeptide transport system ATPase subunit
LLSNPQHDYTKRLMADVPLMHERRSILTQTNAGT